MFDDKDNNSDLDEIKDPEILNQLKSSYSKFQQPILLGSVIPKGKGFTRKQTMMRADLFTLMCITQTKSYVSSHKESNKLKKAAQKYLEYQNEPIVPDHHKAIGKKLSGWNRILFDICNFNYITDVLAINQRQDLAETRKNQE